MTLSWPFWPVLRSGATRRRIRRLVVELERRSEALEDSLRHALGDQELAVAFWLGERGEWVDSSGNVVALPAADASRAVTRIEGTQGPLAALIHDQRLRRDRRLLEAVVAAARLALGNERLEAELRARIVDVRASRERVVATGEAERRRIERDLHDGAQQRLVSLSLALQMVAVRMGDRPKDHAEQLLEHGMEVAKNAIEELRRIAHGIFPTALAEEGLAVALGGLALAAPIAVELIEIPQVRVGATAEAACYFAAAEAIEAAARQDPQAVMRLAARVTGDHLELSVEHAGGSGVHLHSLDLEDRVDAVGGKVVTGPGWLRVEIPTGDKTT